MAEVGAGGRARDVAWPDYGVMVLSYQTLQSCLSRNVISINTHCLFFQFQLSCLCGTLKTAIILAAAHLVLEVFTLAVVVAHVPALLPAPHPLDLLQQGQLAGRLVRHAHCVDINTGGGIGITRYYLNTCRLLRKAGT